MSLPSRWPPLLLLFLLPLAYDPYVPDVLHTKQSLFVLGLVFLTTWHFLQHHSLPFSPLPLACFFLLLTPTLLQPPPVFSWFPRVSSWLSLWCWGLWLFQLHPSDLTHSLSKATSKPSETPPFLSKEGKVQHDIPDEPRPFLASFLRITTTSAILVAILAILERFFPLSLPWSGQFGPLVSGPFGNPNHLGAYLAVQIPLTLVLPKRWYGALVPMIWALLLTGSRLSLLSTCLFLALWPLLFQRSPNTEKNVQKHIPSRWFPTLLALGMLAGSFFFTPSKNLATFEHAKGGWKGRVHLLQCTKPMWRTAVPWGMGWGEFVRRFPIYRGDCLLQNPHAREFRRTIIAHLHNDPLEALLEGGIPMLFFFLGFLFFLGWWFFSRSYTLEQCGCFAALGVGLLHSLGHFVFHVPPVAALLVACASQIFSRQSFDVLNPTETRDDTKDKQVSSVPSKETATNRQSPSQSRPALPSFRARIQSAVVCFAKRKAKKASIHSDSSDESIPTPKRSSSGVRRSPRFFLLFSLLCWWMLLALGYGEFRRYFAQRTLQQSYHASDKHQTSLALRYARQSQRYFPTVDASFQEGQLWQAKGNSLQAKRALKQAFWMLPDPEIALQLAKVALTRKRPQHAFQWLQKALQLDPYHDPSRRLLQTISRRSGEHPSP